VTREHEDLEVGVFRRDQNELQEHFSGSEQFKSLNGWLPWKQGEFLALPIHQVLFRPPGSGPPADPWEPEPQERQFFLDDVEDGVWICRRDARIKRPVEELTFRSPSGIPAVVPEIQLLYKAKHSGEKDEHDFREALPRLTDEQRSWLKRALELVHPGHGWIQSLA